VITPTKAERKAMAQALGRIGGKARKRNLTSERLTEIGKMGAKARHAKRNGNRG
jgi:hypothetical protein